VIAPLARLLTAGSALARAHVEELRRAMAATRRYQRLRPKAPPLGGPAAARRIFTELYRTVESHVDANGDKETSDAQVPH
jgi:hypothetical protein